MKNILAICLVLFLTGNVFANQNIHTHNVGDFKVSLLSEGQKEGNKSILIGATDKMLSKYAPKGLFPNSVNAFLVRTPSQNILVDTGLGINLIQNLKHLGVSPEKIDILLLTHMHGDHIGGMLRNGEKVFPNAKIYISEPEYNYWTKKSWDSVSDVATAYKQNIILFKPSKLNGAQKKLISGVTAIEAYGHTPGHTMFLLESKGKKLLIWGDLTHAMAIQMPYPKVAVTYDIDPKQAVETRLKVLKYACKNKIPIAGMHIAYPSMGTITSDSNGGYIFEKMK